MKKSGTVIKWNPDRGFGFIRDDSSQGDVFFHIRDFHAPAPPVAGIAVLFDDIQVGGKGPRAISVKPVGATSARPTPLKSADTPESWRLVKKQGEKRDRVTSPEQRQQRTNSATAGRINANRSIRAQPESQELNISENLSPAWPAVLLIAVWLGLLAWGMAAVSLPLVASGIAVLLNLATFMVYWMDKHAAQTGGWRTAENTLHLLALAGGWPGAWAAQQVLRHKSRKQPFRRIFWGTATLNCALLAAWIFWWPMQQFQTAIR